MPTQTELINVPRKNEYIVAYLLEPLAEDTNFGRWPLHITIVPWFEMDNINKAIKAVQQVAKIHKPFFATIGETSYFGPGKNVPVNVVVDSESIYTLHNALVEALETVGAKFPHRHYMGNYFTPHITKKTYAKLQPGYKLKINSIHLIEAPIGNRLTRIKRIISIGHLK